MRRIPSARRERSSTRSTGPARTSVPVPDDRRSKRAVRAQTSRCPPSNALRIIAHVPNRPAPTRRSRAMPLPTLSAEDRKAALAKAAEARRKRAELKAELKSGKRNLKDVLAKNNDDTVGKMKVSNVLEALPGVGKVRARKLMVKLDISASRRIRGLGAKQRESLLAEFSNK